MPGCTHGPLSAKSLNVESTLVEGFVKPHYCKHNAMFVYKTIEFLADRRGNAMRWKLS